MIPIKPYLTTLGELSLVCILAFTLACILPSTSLHAAIQPNNPFHEPIKLAGIDCRDGWVNLDLQQASLQAVVWDLASCANMNLQIRTPLGGKLSLHANHLRADQALHWAIASSGKHLTEQNGLWSISNPPESTNLHWHHAHLHHLDVKQLPKAWLNHFKQGSNEQWVADPWHNQWWVQCTDQRWPEIDSLITAWDHPTPQVAIRAMVMQVDAHTVASLGAMLQSQNLNAIDRWSWGTPQVGTLHLGIAQLGMAQTLTATLQAATESGRGHMLASPHLLTLNHQSAEIETGAQIPYAEKTVYGDSSTAFKKAVLKLAVTPHVLDDQHMLLDINLTQEQVNPLHDTQAPTIQTRSIKTQVRLANRHTLVLGGIEQQHKQHEDAAVPGLSKAPVVGLLFKDHHRREQSQQLLLLITPTLVDEQTPRSLTLPIPEPFAN